MIPLQNALAYSHSLMQTYIPAGGAAIDATLGNGNDAAFIAKLLGKGGRLYGFDVQQEAVGRAREKLRDAVCGIELFCQGHEHMAQCVGEQADFVAFNLGYLPAGDKSVTTKLDTTLGAVKQALELLKPGGVLAICAYPGHEEGARERNALAELLSGLDCRRFTVVYRAFLNANGSPPELFAVQKNA